MLGLDKINLFMSLDSILVRHAYRISCVILLIRSTVPLIRV